MNVKYTLTIVLLLISNALSQQLEIISIKGNPDSLSLVWELKDGVPTGHALFINDKILIEAAIDSSCLQPTYILYMVDTSIPMQKAIKRGIKAFIKKIIESKPINHHYAVATFDDGFTLLEGFTENRDELIAKVRLISGRGNRTELYRSISEGMKIFPEDRLVNKIIVVFSDGDAEDTPAYPLVDVIEKAKKKHIAIFSAAYKHASGKPFDQNLRRLSEETDGLFERANDNYQLPPGFKRKILDSIKYSGQININLKKAAPEINNRRQVTLRVNLQDDNLVESKFSWNFGKPPYPKKLFIGIGAFIFLAIVIIIIILKKRRAKKDLLKQRMRINLQKDNKRVDQSKCAACSAILPPHAKKCPSCGTPVEDLSAIAWFEGKAEKLWPVKSASCQIGALAGNEIVLNHKTISRNHAILDFIDNRFRLTDRNSTNHTYVNEKRITSIGLKDGDIVRFGDLHFRFLINPRFKKH